MATPDVAAMTSRITMPVVWILAVAIFATIASYREWSWRAAELEREGVVAHRIISQRADQHDAHMTNLSALATAIDPPPREALSTVAASVRQFYPRIAAIDLVTIGPEPPAVIMTTRLQFPDDLALLIAGTARQATTQKPSLVGSPALPGRYLLIKRVPNTDAALYALALEIDVEALADMDGTPVSKLDFQLLMPDGTALLPPVHSNQLAAQPAGQSPARVMIFEKTLGSASQPLLLRLQRDASLASVIPWNSVALFGLLAALSLLAYRRYAAARLAEREAQARAAFSEQEARLAHASRVNAMGELSLGIAHELTQPLAAILSQSQAGLRMASAEPPDRPAMVQVLEANVRHARRAGAILGKLRDWVSAKPGGLAPVDINRVVSDVVALTRSDFEKRNITTLVELSSPPPVAFADQVELEQIAYNLLCNAADACEHAGNSKAVIELTTFADGQHIGLRVRDRGPGVPQDVMQKIFEPFHTSKQNGMGLGLTLCQRLAERVGGQLKVANHPAGGAIFTLLLPAAKARQAPADLAAE